MGRLLFAAVGVVFLGCASQAHPLAIADSCACSPKEYCVVQAGAWSCKALPAACGAKPSCACVGTKEDSCRDEDGRLTLLPQRPVASCEACSSEEYCLNASACGVLPPQCDEEKTCDCFERARDPGKKLACNLRSGRIELSSR